MNKKLNFLMFLVILVLVTACNLQQYGITPELQCQILKNGAQIGIDVGLKNISFDQEYIETGYTVLDQTIKRLKGAEVSHQDLEDILLILNAELKTNEKLLVQAGINTFLAVTPNLLPEFTQNSLTKTIIYNLICLFEGVLAGFARHKMKGLTIDDSIIDDSIIDDSIIDDSIIDITIDNAIIEEIKMNANDDFTIQFKLTNCENCN